MKLAKIGAVAEWSWWWVTCPLWGGIALLIVVFIIYLVGSLIIGAGKRAGNAYHKKNGLQSRLEQEKRRDSK